MVRKLAAAVFAVDTLLWFGQRFCLACVKGALLLLLLMSLEYTWLPAYGFLNYLQWLMAWYTLW